MGLIQITHFSWGKLGILHTFSVWTDNAQLPEFLLRLFTVTDMEMDTLGVLWLFQPSAFIWLHFSCLLPLWHQRKSWTWYIKHYKVWISCAPWTGKAGSILSGRVWQVCAFWFCSSCIKSQQKIQECETQCFICHSCHYFLATAPLKTAQWWCVPVT